jgi:hypothetical protein
MENSEIRTPDIQVANLVMPNDDSSTKAPRKLSLYRQMLKVAEDSKKSPNSRQTRGIRKDYNQIENQQLI